ncbi:MAG: efflux RND transporter periplasmic adaptor subunit [Phycisphaerales bacterium]|nr:MAG: efflux RND transporter periplasmic adaptor subunit [Phycisphaerales bacterium]
MSGKSPKKRVGNGVKGWLRRNAWKAVIVAIVIAAVLALGRLPEKDRQAPASPAPPVNVTVMTVTAEPNLADTFKLPAVVEPNRVVTVSAEFEGRIERIPCKEGCEIRAGDLLMQLNEDLIRPAYEMAKAQVERDKIEYNRMKNLVADDATSRRDLDDATIKLAVSEAQLEEVTARLERTRILAPLDGVLNDIMVEEGEYVAVGAPVAEIVETNVIKVVVQVPERDIVFFDVGRQADVHVHTREGNKWLVGKITFISELADQQTRSTRMEITVPNEQRIVRSGQIVTVNLTRRILKDAVMIPLLAVIPMEEGHSVYVVNSSEARRRKVELDIIKGNRVQITSGLEPGDKLIIEGHRFVAPGQKVNIIESK